MFLERFNRNENSTLCNMHMYSFQEPDMPTASRVIYSIEAELLSRFNAAFAPRERSKVVERLIQTVLDQREHSLIDAARKIESDPQMASIRAVSDDIDRIAGEALTDARASRAATFTGSIFPGQLDRIPLFVPRRGRLLDLAGLSGHGRRRGVEPRRI